MSRSCCRLMYSPRVNSPRRAGVAGGVGEGEVVPAGEVFGDATLLSEDADLKKKQKAFGFLYKFFACF